MYRHQIRKRHRWTLVASGGTLTCYGEIPESAEYSVNGWSRPVVLFEVKQLVQTRIQLYRYLSLYYYTTVIICKSRKNKVDSFLL